MTGSIFIFMGIMWFLMIIGGGIAVMVLGPISITGYGDLNQIFSSIIKAIAAVLLVVAWIIILSKTKNWVFRKQITN